MNSVTSPIPPRAARFLRAAGTLTVLCAPLAAQSNRFVVDANGGPGSTHTEVQAALDAAAPGALILVRPGTYQPFVVQGKGVTIQGEEPFTPWTVHRVPSASPAVRVAAVPAGQSAALHDLCLPGRTGIVTVQDCAGSVTVGDLLVPREGRLSIVDCARVVVRGSLIRGGAPAVEILRSRVTLDAVECTGLDVTGLTRLPASIALEIVDADVTLVDCIVHSGSNRAAENSLSAGVPMYPIRMIGGNLELLGLTRVVVAPLAGAGSSALALGLSRGSLSIGPEVVLQPSAGRPDYTGSPTLVPARPSLAVGSLARDFPAGARLRGPAGARFTIYLGVPGAPIQGGGVLGAFELVPALTTPLASGVLPAAGPAREDRLLMVPNDPALTGATLGLQAWVANTASSQAALSNLAATVVR